MSGKITRTKRNTPYVQIDKRPIEDKKLSWKAKGILAYLLSKPDGWEIKIYDLIEKSTDGRDAVRSGMIELEENGYLKKSQNKAIDGKFDGYNYEVIEVPFTDFPSTEKPITENPLYNNNNISNNDINKKKKKLEKENILESFDVTSQFHMSYKPMINCYEMADAHEKLSKYFEYEENVKQVKDAAMSKKTNEEFKKYIQFFCITSFNDRYFKKITTFPDLISRFIEWLRRDRHTTIKETASNVSLQERKDDFIKVLKEKNKNSSLIEIFTDSDIEKFVEKHKLILQEIYKNTNVDFPTTDEWVKIAYLFDTTAIKRKMLIDILEEIKKTAWRQNYKSVYETIIKTKKDYESGNIKFN